MKSNKLFEVLQNTFFLAVKTQNYHWNVVGKDFYQFHKLFEEQYSNLFEASDQIAERIRFFGDKIPAFNQADSKITPLNYDLKDLEMIKDLLESHKKLTQIISEVDVQNDPVTDDILTERLEFHQKAIWMLKSILQ
jgi:starvation-inducible DNA-binding protein